MYVVTPSTMGSRNPPVTSPAIHDLPLLGAQPLPGRPLLSGELIGVH